MAELGRPETAQEMVDRRAVASRTRRQNQNFFNLIIALLASLAVVALVVLVVVRPDAAPQEPVDYRAISLEADAPATLAAPQLPEGWWANQAKYDSNPVDDVLNWNIGLLTPSDGFIALVQGIDANPTWQTNQLPGMKVTGSTTIDGIEWTVYDRRGAKDAGNYAYALSTVGADSTYVLHGTATDDDFTILATKLAATIAADH